MASTPLLNLEIKSHNGNHRQAVKGFDYSMAFVDTGKAILSGSIELEMRNDVSYFYDFGNIEALPGYHTPTLSDQAFQWKRLHKTIMNRWSKVNAQNKRR